MDPVDAYDLPPPRPGAAPKLDTSSAGANIQPRPSNGPQWSLLTPAFIRILQYHFGDASRIEDPYLVGRVWTNQPSSPIVITSLAEWKPDQSNQRPALLVDRLQQMRDPSKNLIGGGQFQGVRPDNYALFMVGSHVIHVVGGREGEADVLAKEVGRELSRFANILAPKLCLNRLRYQETGKRTELTEHKQIYTVPVIMTYEYMEQWRVTRDDEAAVNSIISGITINSGWGT